MSIESDIDILRNSVYDLESKSNHSSYEIDELREQIRAVNKRLDKLMNLLHSSFKETAKEIDTELYNDY